MATVSPGTLDRALRMDRVLVTNRRNARAVRCANSGCRKIVAPGEGKRLYVDGMRTGFIGPCCWGVRRHG